jgi:hypothetical protein
MFLFLHNDMADLMLQLEIFILKLVSKLEDLG